MASIRVAVKQEACRLAAAHGVGVFNGDYCVRSADIVRLQRMLNSSGRPVETLRWAWRSQLATYVDSGSHVDGLATIYLHAALLDLHHGDYASDASDREPAVQ